MRVVAEDIVIDIDAIVIFAREALLGVLDVDEGSLCITIVVLRHVVVQQLSIQSGVGLPDIFSVGEDVAMNADGATDKVQSRSLLPSLFTYQHAHALIKVEEVVLQDGLHDWLRDLVVARVVGEFEQEDFLVSVICRGHICCPSLVDRREAPVI